MEKKIHDHESHEADPTTAKVLFNYVVAAVRPVLECHFTPFSFLSCPVGVLWEAAKDCLGDAGSAPCRKLLVSSARAHCRKVRTSLSGKVIIQTLQLAECRDHRGLLWNY